MRSRETEGEKEERDGGEGWRRETAGERGRRRREMEETGKSLGDLMTKRHYFPVTKLVAA